VRRPDLPLKALVWEDGKGSGRRELQRTGVPGRAAPYRGCPACALRRSWVDRWRGCRSI